MAKKLQFDYVFNAAAQTVTINGHVDLKKLLFINNATRGTTIYALGDPTLRTTNRTYNRDTNQTTFELLFDTATAGHANSDVLQIFIEEEGAEFKPTETFVDPVSKFRVSMPNTLIDTDFEYGLQSTKWETLERIHQIPSFFSSTGDVPLKDIASISTVAGSKEVTVTTSSIHGLVNGIPLDVRGLSSQTAEGTFIIKSIPSETTFIYEANRVQAFTGNIGTVYSNVIVGRFYVGSKLNLGNYSAVTTDQAALSTLTITTPVKSNYSLGTAFYITNSIAVRRKEFNGRAFTSGGAVDFSSTISLKQTGYLNIWDPEGNDTRQYLVSSAQHMNFSTYTFTYYESGVVTSHQLETGDFMQMKYVNGNITGFIAAGQTGTNASSTSGGSGIYYVIKVSDTAYQLATSPQNAAAGVPVQFTGADTQQQATQLEMRRYGRGYSSTVMNPYEYDIIEVGDPLDPAFGRRQRFFRPESIDVAQDTITIPNHQFKDGQPVVLSIGPTPNSTIGGLTAATNSQCYPYYIKYIDADTIKLTASFTGRDPSHTGPYYGAGVGAAINITSQGILYTWGTPYALWPAIKVAYSINQTASGGSQTSSSFATRNRIICEHSTVNFAEGDKIVFYSQSGVPGGINESTNNWAETFKDRVYYVRFPAINTLAVTRNFEFSVSTTPSGPIVDITSWADTENCFVMKVEEVSTSNTWYSPGHGFTTNQLGHPDYWLKYRFDAQNGTGTAVGGMTSNYWYWMIPVTNNHFRVSLASSSTSNDQPASPNQNLQQNATSTIINLTTFGTDVTNFRHRFVGENIANPFVDTFYIPNHGFTEGNAIRYNSNGNVAISGLTNGTTYYVLNASQDRFQLSLSYAGPKLDVQGGSPTSSPDHYFEDVSSKGSIDGSFTITSKDPNELSYGMQTDTQIFGKTLVFYPQRSVNLKYGHFFIENHNLKTGTEVVYTVPTGGTAIGRYSGGPDPVTQPQYTALTSGNTYYVYRISKDYFALAETLQDAQNENYLKEYYDFGNLYNQGIQHTIYANSVFGEVQGNGRVTYTTRDKTWDGSLATNVNTYSNYVTITAHGFNTGDFVEYNGYAGATPIVGLEFGKEYYIHRWGTNELSFHTTQNEAYRRQNPVRLYGPGTGTLHIIRISTNLLKGTTNRGRWNSTSEYFVGDIIQYTYSNVTYYYVATQDSLGNYDDLRYDYSNASNVNRVPPNNIFDAWWRRLNDYTQSASVGSGLATNMVNQYTTSEKILINDTRYIGYNYGYGYYNYNNVSGNTVSVPSSNRHGFEIGDGVWYRNEGKWRALEAGLNPDTQSTDYGGIVDGNMYFANPITTTTFSLHNSPEEARQGINPIGLTASTGSTTYYNYHRFYKVESYVVEASIVSISGSDEMTILEPREPEIISFNPQETTPIIVCDPNTDTFYLPGYGHKLFTGDRIIYSHDANSTNIAGLTKDGNYFIINLGNDYFRLAGNGTNSYTYRQQAYSTIPVNITSTGTGTGHFFTLASENYNNAEYLIPTALYVKPSAYALHRPFDGGVEINPGTSADSSIVRQTRRYFRYQSGKGLQYSTATNFNPPLEVQSLTADDDNGTPIARVITRKPHNLVLGDSISMEDVISTGTDYYNGDNFTVADIVDDFEFTYTLSGIPSEVNPAGFPTLNKNGWTNAFVRAGMFDDQNGFFFEYDGTNLNCVRRSSTQQTAGTISVTQDSQTVNGNGTIFTRQLSVDDYVVIRGLSFRIASIESDTQLQLTRPYPGITADLVIMTKTIDTKTPQSGWNLDRCDGSGGTGYELNLKRLQMCYIDYSWYGGGKIRYGFKDQLGKVFYAHQYVHNNNFTEAYFRSGNLPARYEVATIGDKVGSALFAPSLFHWGASVIMDGEFEDDKAYLFSASSSTVYLLNQKSDGDEQQANRAYPLLSIRLAPSVDAGVTGKLGARDIINRMQLQLKQVSITISDGGVTSGAVINQSSQDPRKSCTVRLILNADLSQPKWTAQPSPALSEVVYHTIKTDVEFARLQDRISNGVPLFEFRAQANATTVQDLGDVANLGNSILGGDYTFPNGPDTLTVVVIPDGSYTGTSRQYTNCSARITWTESQA